MRGSEQGSTTVSRTSAPMIGWIVMSGAGGMSGLAGIGPNWRSIMASAAAGSKSPATVRTALFGA